MSIHSLWRVYPVIMTCHKCLHLGPEFYNISFFRTKAIQIWLLFKHSRAKIQVLSFWTWALKQCCRVWKTLQLSFWAFLHLSFKSTGNFVLQTSPCSFLKLRKDPWEICFPFLLCSFSLLPYLLWHAAFFPTSAISIYPFLFSLSLPQLRHAQERALARGAWRKRQSSRR
jgi:hypothetical protein